MNVVVLHAVVLLATLNVDLMPGYFFDPSVDETKYREEIFGSDSVPIVQKEKIILESSQSPASAVVVLMNLPFGAVVQEIREYMHQTLGVMAEEDISTRTTTSSPGEDVGQVTWAAWPVFGKNLSKLKALGLSVDRPKQYKFSSEKYNLIKEMDAYSVMEAYIIDASSFLGKPVYRDKEYWAGFMKRIIDASLQF